MVWPANKRAEYMAWPANKLIPINHYFKQLYIVQGVFKKCDIMWDLNIPETT